MAVDKLVDSSQLNTDLTSVANAIRTKGGTSAQLAFPAEFVSAIAAIPTGGSDRPEADDNDVILIDMDGRILYSYTAADFANLTELPTIPTLKYSFLQQDGWNWTLSDAKTYVAKYKELVIGAQYTIDSNVRQYIYVEIPRTLTWAVSINIPNSGTSSGNSITVDWGDGSTPTEETGIGRNVTKVYEHTFTKGSYAVSFSSNRTDAEITNYRYRGYVKALTYRRSNLSYYQGEYDLIFLTGCIGTMGKMAQNTYGNAYVYPRGFTNIIGNSNWFSSAPSQKVHYVSWPKNFIGALYGYNYQYCRFLRKLTVPEETVEMNNSTLQECYTLYRFNITENITSIASKAIQNCGGLKELHFYPSTPPTVAAADAFSGLPTACTIYVPSGKLTDYTTASNYPDSNTYTYVEES